MELTTTLDLLRKAGACKDRYKVLAKALGKGYGKDTPIPLLRILESNGLGDALWALRAVPPEQVAQCYKLSRILVTDYTKRAGRLMEWLTRQHPTMSVWMVAQEAIWDTMLAARGGVSDERIAGKAEYRWQAEHLRELLADGGEKL